MGWVMIDKIQEGERKRKARLVAREFKEEYDQILKDSSTCSKESLWFILTIMTTKKRNIRSIEINAAFLQGKLIDREVYFVP